MSTPDTVKVGLIWHAFGHDNLGVDALSRANMAIIDAAATRQGLKASFVTLGTGQKPQVDDLPDSVTIGPTPSLKQLVKGRSEFLKLLRTCDVAVDIGEGDSFTDLYSRRRFAFHCGTKAASILLRQPLILAPQTIGPFEHPVHRWIATRLINGATAVYTRDHLSTAFLEELGTRSPHEEFIDVAFRLPYTQAPKAQGRVRVGINVSGLLYHGGYTGANELGMALDYPALTHALIERFQAMPDVDISLFAHVAGGGYPDDDAPAIETLGKLYPGITIVPKFRTSIEAKSWISGQDFVIAGRMHACIGAYSSGVPVVPIAYSRKFNGLFGTLGYPYFVDGKATTAEKALADIMSFFEQRDRLKATIVESQPIIEERLGRYEDRIASLLAAAVQKRSARS